MRHLLTFLFLFSSSTVFATPGDIGCSAVIGKKRVEVIVGRDYFDQPPVFVEVLISGKVVARFDAETITEGMVVIRDESQEVLLANSHISAAGESGLAYLRFPETSGQNPQAFATLNLPSANLAVVDLNMSCEF
jgi:hypothetical protein